MKDLTPASAVTTAAAHPYLLSRYEVDPALDEVPTLDESDESVGTAAVWTVSVASLLLATLFAGPGGGAMVLGGISLVALGRRRRSERL